MSDVEKIMGDYAQLTNHNIRSFLWRGVSVSVKDRQTHEDKPILNNVSGIVYAGELMAVMGPSYVTLILCHPLPSADPLAVVQESLLFSTFWPTVCLLRAHTLSQTCSSMAAQLRPRLCARSVVTSNKKTPSSAH
jgi:hypothetical protein